MSSMVMIFNAQDVFEAKLMQQALAAEGIEATMTGDQLSNSYIGPHFDVPMFVPAEQAEQAKELVAQISQSIRDRKSTEEEE